MKEKPSKEKSKPIKQFRDKSMNFWCDFLHYTLAEGEIICCAGGVETEDSRARIEKYLRNKKLI